MSVVTVLAPVLVGGGLTLVGVVVTQWYTDRRHIQERARDDQERARERASAANAKVEEVVVALLAAVDELRLALVHNTWKVRAHEPALRVMVAAERANLLPHSDVRDAASQVRGAAIRTAVVAYDMDTPWQRKKAQQKADADLSAALGKLRTAANAHLHPAAETTQKDVR